jgi:hypothetical protein
MPSDLNPFEHCARTMPQISGHVRWSDGSPASGHKVSGMAAGMLGGMVGPTTTDSRGYFCLSWNSSATKLDTVYVDGKAVRWDVRDGTSDLNLPAS